MELEKAIEILTKFEGGHHRNISAVRHNALNLGIKALQRELDNRSGSKYVIVAPLNGETVK